jgi:hypothetical protein
MELKAMRTEEIIIKKPSGVLKEASGAIYSPQSAGVTIQTVVVQTTTPWMKTYLSAEDDPVLAELWDNDDDAVYDSV